ncbi:MAG: ABC transporter ATP-binding protein [Clostridia bacterium]
MVTDPHRLSVQNLSLTFGKHTILRNISHTFTGGNIYGIVGSNGCGKTVLMKCICGLLPADTGNITFDNEKTTIPQGTFGVVIETPGFLPDFSGYANLAMLAGLRRKVCKEEILSVLQDVGLRLDAKKKVGKYSLGMRQRLGIAQAVMDDPPVLLLDEPLNGLDQASVERTYDLLMRMRDKGKIILLASHHKQDIDSLCDEVLDIDDGLLREGKAPF